MNKLFIYYFFLNLLFASFGYSSNTALAVYLKNPNSSDCKTRLANGSSPEVANTFYEHCLNIISEDLLELQNHFSIVICPSSSSDFDWAADRWPNYDILPQEEFVNLGNRMQATINQLLKEGHKKVLLMGSDIPALSTEYILQNASLIDHKPVVLGPSEDGGYYLIGTRVEIPTIEAVRWSTQFALKDTINLLSKSGISVALGPICNDVDIIEDLFSLEEHLINSQGNRLLLSNWLKQVKKVSIIIPVLNEEQNIEKLASSLLQLTPLPEIIFVDGGSTDNTIAKIRQSIDCTVISAPRGNRGLQMNLGAQHAKGAILLFLHADTLLDQQAYHGMLKAALDPNISGGAFSYSLQNSEVDLRLHLIERGVALRNKIFHMPYGDQAYFIKKKAWKEVGPYKEFPLMEDVEWFERVKKSHNTVILEEKIKTSGRRILKKGWIKSSLINISLVVLYKLGIDPMTLAKIYYNRPQSQSDCF